jgi:alpha-glucosidase
MYLPPDLQWTAGLHHDGSAVYVSNPYPKLEEKVTISLRAPLDAPLRGVYLRTEPDGEAHYTPMQITQRNAVSAFWSATIHITMLRTHYRFKLMTPAGSLWLNALGITRSDGPDGYDFKLLANYAAPRWVHDAVFYQIFPDRFHNGDPSLTIQPGSRTKREFSVQVRNWGDPPLSYREAGNLDFYGGDLPGIAQKLDYLEDLGVNAIYLTPIFTSPSNHRYNIDDFYNVDPHLGGNQALAELRQAMDQHDMRLMLDITPNHVSSLNPWFLDAQQNENAPTADFFTFNRRPNDYVAWLGVKSLPKLNYNSARLREVMYEAPDSIIRLWLKDPYRIDGWRLDVANMTGRLGVSLLTHKVKRGIRRAAKDENPEAYLIGENFFDGTPYLQGDELDAIQNYQGFNIPMWRWLNGKDNGWLGDKGWVDRSIMPSEAFAEQLTLYRAAVPWVIANQQFNQLGSHDTPRILTVVDGDKELARLGAFLLMTYPGVPCVYYGDEIGMEGAGDPDNRRTMIWESDHWDTGLRAFYQKLITLRKASSALKTGGYQQLIAERGLFAFMRQSPEQTLIIVANRDSTETPVTLPVWQAGIADGTTAVDLLSDKALMVQNGVIELDVLSRPSMLMLEVR